MSNICTQTVEERGPSATTVELGCTLIQRSTTTCAGIDSFLVELVVLSCPRGFSALLTEDTELRVPNERHMDLRRQGLHKPVPETESLSTLNRSSACLNRSWLELGLYGAFDAGVDWC